MTELLRVFQLALQELFASTGRCNRIGSYWEKGNQNEIDLVAINDMEKKIVIAHIILNPNKINLEILKNKSRKLLAGYLAYRLFR